MRSYYKVYGTPFGVHEHREDGDDVFALLHPKKAGAIENFNALAGFGWGRPQDKLIWYLIDTTTGTPPGGGEVVVGFDVANFAQAICSLIPYELHKPN